jgi:hypothetical protein
MQSRLTVSWRWQRRLTKDHELDTLLGRLLQQRAQPVQNFLACCSTVHRTDLSSCHRDLARHVRYVMEEMATGCRTVVLLYILNICKSKSWPLARCILGRKLAEITTIFSRKDSPFSRSLLVCPSGLFRTVGSKLISYQWHASN